MLLSPSETLWLICAALSGAYIPGLVALVMPLRVLSTAMTSAVSAGLLLGAGLCVILPEGFHTLQEAQEGMPESQHVPAWAAGAALLAGFLMMTSLDALRPSHQSHEEGCPGHMHHHSHEHNHSLIQPLPPSLANGYTGSGVLHGQAQKPGIDCQHHDLHPALGAGDMVADSHGSSKPCADHHSQSSAFAAPALQMQLREQFPEHSTSQAAAETCGHHHSLQVQPQQLQHQHEHQHAEAAPHQVPHLVLEPPTSSNHLHQQHRHHHTACTRPKPPGIHVGGVHVHHAHIHPRTPGHQPTQQHLPARNLSRQVSAPVCYHPPHPFAPSDCQLLPACSWQPPQQDEACEREMLMGSETASDEEHESLVHVAIREEDSMEAAAQLEEAERLVGCPGHLHHHHHITPVTQVAVVIPGDDDDDLTTGLLAAEHTSVLLTPAGPPLPSTQHKHSHLHHNHHNHLHHHGSHRRSMQGPLATGHNQPLPARPVASKLRDARQALIGLVIHSCADGLAVGAAALSNNLAVSLTIALSIMVHKMPVAYGLAAFLRAAGRGWQSANQGLLAFVAAAPLTALTTYYVLGSLTWAANPQVVALSLLASGGTVLHAGAVHVLPSAGTRPRSLLVMSLATLVPLIISAFIADD